MAAPRCTCALLRPVRKVKIQPDWRISSQKRMRSSVANDDEDATPRQQRATTAMPYRNVDTTGMTLEQRLESLGMDPAEFKKTWKQQQAVAAKIADFKPKTREEAAQRWKEMQDTPDHLNLLEMYKSAGLEPIKLAKQRGITLPTDKPPLDPETQDALEKLRDPINVFAMHLRPLRRSPTYGVPTCDLQLRTYSIRNLLLFADFAMRAAYYMGLPARGPIPLPRITERWTVPRANFVMKKSQENFERITMRRLIQIQDGHVDVVKAWLAFLLEHQFHGVGMKANIWEYEDLETATRAGYAIDKDDYSRRRQGPVLEKVREILGREEFQQAMKGEASQVEMRP